MRFVRGSAFNLGYYGMFMECYQGVYPVLEVSTLLEIVYIYPYLTYIADMNRLNRFVKTVS